MEEDNELYEKNMKLNASINYVGLICIPREGCHLKKLHKVRKIPVRNTIRGNWMLVG